LPLNTDIDKHHELVANQGGVYGLGEKPEHNKTQHDPAAGDEEIVANQELPSRQKKQKRDNEKKIQHQQKTM
jgi:hypothetical protein